MVFKRLMWALCKVPLPVLSWDSRFSFQASYVKPPSLSQLTENSLQAFPFPYQGPSQLLHLLRCGCFPFTSCHAGLQRASPACSKRTFGAQQRIRLIGCGWIQGVLHKASCFLLLGKLVLSCLFLLLSLDASNLNRAQCPQPVCDSH